jgi:hypothetical protein
MHFQQMELALEFSLSGNAEQDSRLLPLARILPGFDEESLRQGICRIRLPLDKAGGLAGCETSCSTFGAWARPYRTPS